MLGLRSRAASEWSPPPCVCDEIEARVRLACAMRDEMATWPSPIEEWRRLQEMPVLAPKGAVAAKPMLVMRTGALLLANPAHCPHPMKRFEAATGWRCTECGAIVKPVSGYQPSA